MDKKKVEARLKKLADLGGGRLTPDSVVEDAKSPRSPLHDWFEWDDTEAAHQWRLTQARELIRSVRVEVQTEHRTVSTVRYVRDPNAGNDEQGYVEVARLRKESDLAREALRREIIAANALLDRVQELSVALGLEGEVSEIRESFNRLEVRLVA